jgi:hypothetical protein
MAADLLDQALNQLAPKHVSVEEFAESDEYCNKPLYPGQAVLLKTIFLEELTGPEEDILDNWIAGGRNGTEVLISPNIRERVQWLRDEGYPHFREIILVGGRRSSKGFCTGISMAKTMWDCLQLQDPGSHYGIDPEKEIYFSCVAGSEEQAKEFQYADFSSTVETCKSFDPYLVKSLETEIRVATNADLRRITQEKSRGNRIQKDIARLRGKALAANAGTLRGSATMCICIDEMAHMIPGESKAAADKVYEAADPSLDQFGADGMMFCNSSPYTKVGMFFERHEAALVGFDPERPIDEIVAAGEEGDIDIKDLNGNPRIFTLQFPSWLLFQGYQKSKNRKKLKHVLMGCPEWDVDEVDEKGDELWNDKDKLLIRAARAKEQANPESYKVERRGKFAEVTDAYINPARVDQMFGGLPAEWIYENGPDEPPKMRLEPFNTNWGKGATNMFRYKFHLDPSSTTAGFGFAIAHTEIIADHQGVDEEHVVFDVIKRWQPERFPGKVIRWPTVLQEVMQLAEAFHPFEITFDQHESVQPIQELQEKLQEKNQTTRVFLKPATAELNWRRWEVCKTSIYAGVVHAPNDTEDARWCSQELKFLQIQGGTGKFPKVDRQEIGPVQTKDMADCVAECINTLIGNKIMNRTRERLSQSAIYGGAQGGFGIGVDPDPFQRGGDPMGAAGSYHYPTNKERAADAYQNPARGVLGGGGRSGRRGNRARW